MKQYRYNGIDFVETDNSIEIQLVRDGNIVFSTGDGKTCHNFHVKFLNRYNKVHHNEPRSDFIEMVVYSLISNGSKKILLSFFCGLVLQGPVNKLNSFSFLIFFKTIPLRKLLAYI